MRNEISARVETRELDDSDLDNVSGGLSAGGYVNGHSVDVYVDDAVGTVQGSPLVGQAVALGRQVGGQATGLAPVNVSGL